MIRIILYINMDIYSLKENNEWSKFCVIQRRRIKTYGRSKRIWNHCRFLKKRKRRRRKKWEIVSIFKELLNYHFLLICRFLWVELLLKRNCRLFIFCMSFFFPSFFFLLFCYASTIINTMLIIFFWYVKYYKMRKINLNLPLLIESKFI